MPIKNMNFPTLESLEPVQQVLDEVDEALQDPKRTILDSAIPGLLMHASIFAYNNAGSFRVLWNLGAGAAKKIPFHNKWVQLIIGAAAAALAATWGISRFLEHSKVNQMKDRMYKEALLKQNRINEAQKEEINALKERLDYLHSLNVALGLIVNDLSEDREEK